MSYWILLIAFLTVISGEEKSNLSKDKHGRIKMGKPMTSCDDGKTGIEIDWANETDHEYTCGVNETIMAPNNIKAFQHCRTDGKRKKFPMHQCLNHELKYDDEIPTWGNHRPLWPVYGQYLYLPPQRWLHTLEHKGTVFLYHPCAEKSEVQKLVKFVESCFYKWVLTPNRHLTAAYPFAVVTFGCIYKMGHIDESSLKDYLKDHSLIDGLENAKKDGQYSFGLLKSSYPKNLKLLDNEKICVNKYSDITAENELLDNLGSKS